MMAAQCKMARVALGLGVHELAARAGVSHDTVYRLEKGGELQPRTTRAIRLALEFCWRRVISGRRRAASQGPAGRAKMTGRGGRPSIRRCCRHE